MFGAIVDFFVGSFLLISFSIVFFTVLAVASYIVFGYYIGGGGDVILAPDLTAKPVIEAMEIGRQNYLSIYLDREESSVTVAEGEVILQNPKPGTKIKRRTPIRVVVSSGSRHLPLPADLVSLSRREAGIRLREMGLTIGNVAYLAAPGQPEDVVMATDPPPGTGVPPGSAVNLLVSVEPGTLAGDRPPMPKLIGKTREEAENAIAHIEGAKASFREESQEGAEPGRVHSQVPAPGQPLLAGQEIVAIIAP